MSRLSDAAECYRHTFAARQDDFVSWSGTAWARAGRELTADAVLAGIDGSGPPLSGYFLTPQSTGHVAAIDFDSDDGMASAARCRDLLLRRGAPSYVEASRRGAHLWVVIDRALPGLTLRRFLRAAVRDAGVEQTPKVEFRPAQDEIRPDGYGSPLRLPTMPNPKTGLRYPVLDVTGRPLPPRLDDLVLAIDFAPAYVVESMAQALAMRPSEMPASYFPPKCLRQGPVESVVAVLEELWGVQRAVPGRATKCPCHEDRNPSLSIARDEERCWCHAPSCVLNNDGRGRGPAELRMIHAGRLS